MARITLFIDKLLRWEGGDKFTNDPIDKGGPTKFGVTLATWKLKGSDPDRDKDGDVDGDDVKLIGKQDFLIILKETFWDKCKADEIVNQSVAEAIVDWAYNAGASVPIKAVQRILGLKEDGQIGPITIKAINSHDQKELHDRITNARISFYDSIIARNPSQVRFEKGWKRRALDYKFVE